jgi:hypothetical protein
MKSGFFQTKVQENGGEFFQIIRKKQNIAFFISLPTVHHFESAYYFLLFFCVSIDKETKS